MAKRYEKQRTRYLYTHAARTETHRCDTVHDMHVYIAITEYRTSFTSSYMKKDDKEEYS